VHLGGGGWETLHHRTGLRNLEAQTVHAGLIGFDVGECRFHQFLQWLVGFKVGIGKVVFVHGFNGAGSTMRSMEQVCAIAK
jgi:hypothetical protein